MPQLDSITVRSARVIVAIFYTRITGTDDDRNKYLGATQIEGDRME
ncbi:MAG: hypothetical protein WD572_03685 [Gammaproteobacteria bacterium]